MKNLHLQALTLHVRWEWLRRTDTTRPWQGITLSSDNDASVVFDSLVKTAVGSGARVLFWKDRWVHGFKVDEIAPLVASLVSTRGKNARTVEQAFDDNAWTLDVEGELSFTAHMQVANLCLAIATVPCNPNAPDEFLWTAYLSSSYTAKLVYIRLCMGLERSPADECIWRS